MTLSSGSGSFTGQKAARPHLVRGSGGLAGEIADLRQDIADDLGANVVMALDEYVNEPVADVNAIKASFASSASAEDFSGTDLDGVVGTAVMDAPRNITITTTSHADIDAVDVVITGTDINGAALTDTITLTDGGNTTDVGTACFRTVTRIQIPAQSGTGGALEIGFGASVGLSKPITSRGGAVSLTREIVGGVVLSELVVQELVDLATADVDAIVETPRATSASEDTLSGPTILDGVIGDGGVMDPPRNVTITSSSHADFDAVDVVVTGTDLYGNAITDTITLTDAGNTTDAGTVAFRTVTQLVVPAQSGTGGTYTVGFGVVVGLPAPIQYLAGDPQVLSENDAGTPKGVDALAHTYATAATTPPCGTVTHATAPDASNDYGLVFVAARGTLASATAAAPNGSYTPVSPFAGAATLSLEYEYDASQNT